MSSLLHASQRAEEIDHEMQHFYDEAIVAYRERGLWRGSCARVR